MPAHLHPPGRAHAPQHAQRPPQVAPQVPVLAPTSAARHRPTIAPRPPRRWRAAASPTWSRAHARAWVGQRRTEAHTHTCVSSAFSFRFSSRLAPSAPYSNEYADCAAAALTPGVAAAGAGGGAGGAGGGRAVGEGVKPPPPYAGVPAASRRAKAFGEPPARTLASPATPSINRGTYAAASPLRGATGSSTPRECDTGGGGAASLRRRRFHSGARAPARRSNDARSELNRGRGGTLQEASRAGGLPTPTHDEEHECRHT